MSAPQASAVPLCGKKTAGQLGTAQKNILINCFKVSLTKNEPVYKYDMRILVNYPKATRPREITKQIKDDYSEVKRKQLTAMIMDKLVEEEGAFFGRRIVVHDRAANVYSLDELPIADKENGTVFTKGPGYVPTLEDAETIKITIKPVNESFQTSTNTLDNLFKEFANVAVTHEAFKDSQGFVIHRGNILVQQPELKGFHRDDAPNLPGMAKALPKIQKSVKVVEGNNKDKKDVVLVLDVGKAPIHLPCTLEKKITSIVTECTRRPPPRVNIADEVRKNPKIAKALKNLELKASYRNDQQRTVIFKGFAGAANKEVIADKKMTVEQYYKTQLNIPLKHPEWPLVKDLRSNLYPIEVLSVLEFQRVRTAQQMPEQSDKIIKASAVLPIFRKQQTSVAFNALGLQDSALMSKIGFKVHDEMLPVPSARLLPTPLIEYSQTTPVKDGKWQMKNVNFLRPAQIAIWAVWANVEDRNLELVNSFVSQFVKSAGEHGLKLNPNPEKVHIEPSQMDEYMADMKEKNVQFILMISEDYEERHKELKYLEIKYNIATQEVRVSVARNAVTKNQRITFDNIVLKTNVKNKGLNHSIKIPSSPSLQNLIVGADRMIFGIDMSHPTAGSDKDSVSVLGWAANCLDHPAKYTGNFIFVPPRETEPDLTLVFKQALGRSSRYRKAPPKFVDIFMGGVSEGQLPRVGKAVVGQLRAVCALLKFTPIVTLIAVSSDHAERLYKRDINAQDRAPQQSVTAGTVVDKDFVNSLRSEFFLLSHIPVQGTASVPKYTVVVDTSNTRTMDDIEMQTYGLCHLHQYSLMTTKIPTPLYVASDYAKRGADVYPFILRNDLSDGDRTVENINGISYQRTALDNSRMA